MSCSSASPPSSEQIEVHGPGVSYRWLTKWVLAEGLSGVDALVQVRHPTGGWRGTPCWQACAVRPAEPDAPALFDGDVLEGTGLFRAEPDLDRRFLVRFGLASTADEGHGSAQVEVRFAYDQCAQLLGAGRFAVTQGLVSGGDVAAFPIGDWTPRAAVGHLRGAFTVVDHGGGLELGLGLRAANDPQAPGPWRLVEDGWTAPCDGHSERNTGRLGADADRYFVQAGLLVRRRRRAHGDASAEIYASVAASRGR